MEQSPMTIILVGVVCVILGFVAALLLNTLRDDTDAPAEEIDQSPPGGRKGHYTVVARLWRERGTGKQIVEMDGRSFITPDALDATQRERLEHSARELRSWLGMGLDTSAAIQNPAQTTPAASDPNRVVLTSASQAAQQPAAQPVTVTPPPPIRAYTPAPVVNPLKASGDKDTPAAPKSMVMQIEDILQDLVAGTPMAARGVHLTEDPKRGVIVQVGLEFFEGIEAVSDPDVKATIRQAVQAWEATQ